MKLSAVPNVLTILRGLCALAFPFVTWKLRLVLFAVAALTEFFDGYLARLWNATSKLGQVLDPIADKLFAVSAGLTFVTSGRLSLPLLALVLIRDETVVLGVIAVMIFALRPLRDFEPRGLGKWTTAFQYAYFLSLIMGAAASGPLFFVTLVFGIAAAVDYAVAFVVTSFHLAG